MPVLNLRNVPDQLMRELRAEAALAGTPSHAFYIALLEDALVRRRISRNSYPARGGDFTREAADQERSMYCDSTMQPPAPPRAPMLPYELLSPAAPDLPPNENLEIEIT